MMSKMGLAVSGFFRSFFLMPIYLIKILISFGSSDKLKVCDMGFHHGVSFFLQEVGLAMYFENEGMPSFISWLCWKEK